MRDEDPQNEELNVQGKRNEEAKEEDDILIANIRKSVIKNVTKSQKKFGDKEVVNINEETETDEEPNVIMMRSIAKFIADRVKD